MHAFTNNRSAWGRILDRRGAPSRTPVQAARAVTMPCVVLLLSLATYAAAAEPDLNVKWQEKYDGIAFEFRGEHRAYPQDTNVDRFPGPGTPLQIAATSEWPVVTLHARWSASTEGWPDEYRSQAMDLILMWACDAELYAHAYPDTIKESKFTYPPDFLREAESPLKSNLAQTLRGRKVAYEITGKGGFGAADYVIRTEIRMGLSPDGKTVFYHDNPKSISEHLRKRDFVFMAHDAGDRLLFEIHAVCICAPRRLFRGEALKRVQSDGEYLIRKMYEKLRAAPSRDRIEAYLASVKQRTRSFPANGEEAERAATQEGKDAKTDDGDAS